MHLNIRSLRNKIPELEALISSIAPDIVVLTEHWLCESEIGHTRIGNYVMAAAYCRSSKAGGGVCILTNREINFSKVDLSDFSTDSVGEVVGIRVNVCGSFLNVLGAYRSPNGDFNQFVDVMDSTLASICSANDFNVVCGDFNVDLLVESQSQRDLINLFASFNLCNVVSQPTRLSATRSSLIDVMFTDLECHDIAVTTTHISDHCTLDAHFSLPVNEVNRDHSQLLRRSFSESNIAKFLSLLEICRWSDSSELSFQVAFEAFHNNLINCFNASFPLHRSSSHGKVTKSWVDDEVRTRSNFIKDIFRRDRIDGSLEFHNYYLSEKRKYRAFLNHKKKTYHDNLIRRAPNTQKAAWNLINHFRPKTGLPEFKINNGDTCLSNPDEVATFLNDFFTSVEAPPVDAGTGTTPVGRAPTFGSLFLAPVTEEELSSIIGGMSSSRTCGVDGLPGFLLKRCLHIIKEPLLHLLNRSLSEGTFPNALKRSRVLPIYKKKGSSNDPNNFRPIAIQPQLSKIFEKVFYTRLSDYFEANGLYSKYQHGFRPGLGTQTALVAAVNYIAKSLDMKNFTAAIFYDFSRAFDTVNHDLLLRKAERKGVRGIALKWLKSYLSNRSQSVEVRGHVSDPLPVTMGVPQGSLLGPLLFLILIDDLPDCLPRGILPVIYADDSNCILSLACLDEVLRMAQAVSDALVIWSRNNGLKLNSSKTTMVQFIPRTSVRESSWLVRVDGVSVNHQDTAKFLGVYLDSKLSWRPHILEMSAKLHKLGFLFRALFNVVSIDTLRTLYFGHVYSRLAYGIICWGPSPHSSAVFAAQRRIIRLMAGVGRRHPCQQLFIKYGLMTVPSIYIYFAAIYVRSNFTAFASQTNKHSYVTRNRDALRAPYCRTNVGYFSPECFAVRVFNMLPSEIKNVPNMPGFKFALKTFLINKSYYSVNEFFAGAGT